MSYQTLLVEERGTIRVVRLNLPDRLNPLDLVMREELHDAMQAVSADPAVRVVMLTGSGRAFCAGGDLGTMEGITAPRGRERLLRLGRLVRTMVGMPQPIVAAVNGAATGAGLALVLCCDLAVASETARFGAAQVRVGLVPDMGLLHLLPLRVGMARAKEMMMTGELLDARTALQWGLVNQVVPPGELMDARTALQWGLVNQVVPPGELMDRALGMCRGLADGPPMVLSMIKGTLSRWPMGLETLLDMEAHLQAVCFPSEDFSEGRRAFLEKRPPKFQGN